MVSRNQLIIVTAICILGLMGPIAYFFQPGGEAEAPAETPSTPSTPGYFVPAEEYSATIAAIVSYKEPVIMASGTSDLANIPALETAITGIQGVKAVTIDKEDNPGEGGIYALSFTIDLNDGSDGARVGYLLPRRAPSIAFKEIAQPASLTLPPTIEMDTPTGKADVATADAAVTAIVFSYAEEGGEYSFNVRGRESAGTKELIALMTGASPNYPTETEEFSVPVTVLSINSYGLESTVPASVNTTEEAITQTLSEYDAEVSYSPPSPFIMVNASNATLFLEELNMSDALEVGGLALVPYNDDAAARIEDVLKNMDGEFTLPEGRLQLRAETRVPADSVPGTVSSEFTIADIELPETLGNRSTGEFSVLPDRKMPVDAKEGDSIDAVVTLTMVFGEVDSANAVAASLQ